MNSIESLWKGAVRPYFSMIRFSHSLFALPFVAIALLQAVPQSALFKEGLLSTQLYCTQLCWLILKVTVCMVSLRSAAMGFNRIADRHYDARNPRTEQRELPAGRITPGKAAIFTAIAALIFLLTASTINELTALLAPLALGLALFYSYTKRFTYLSHFLLGLIIGISPIAVWIAATATVELLPILWGAGLLFYISAFDILYSCQDREFDLQAGLHSLPQHFGISRALWIARLCHILALLFFWGAGYISALGIFYFGATIVIAGLFLIEHILAQSSQTSKTGFDPGHGSKPIPIAFFHINASIGILLLAGILIDLYLQYIP